MAIYIAMLLCMFSLTASMSTNIQEQTKEVGLLDIMSPSSSSKRSLSSPSPSPTSYHPHSNMVVADCSSALPWPSMSTSLAPLCIRSIRVGHIRIIAGFRHRHNVGARHVRTTRHDDTDCSDNEIPVDICGRGA